MEGHKRVWPILRRDSKREAARLLLSQMNHSINVKFAKVKHTWVLPHPCIPARIHAQSVTRGTSLIAKLIKVYLSNVVHKDEEGWFHNAFWDLKKQNKTKTPKPRWSKLWEALHFHHILSPLTHCPVYSPLRRYILKWLPCSKSFVS